MIKPLDCTLKDGKYYTNWYFNKELIRKYFDLVEILPIEYIEVEYRSQFKDKYIGECFYSPISKLKNIKKYTSTKLALMFNSKDCRDIELIKLMNDLKGYISLEELLQIQIKQSLVQNWQERLKLQALKQLSM